MASILKFGSRYLATKSMNNMGYFKQMSSSISVSKDLIKQNKEMVGSTTQDVLMNTLKTAMSTKNILEIVNMHCSVMNNKHHMQALRSLFTLQKSGNTNLSTQEILRNRDFSSLCQGLRQQAGAIELNETIEAIKVINFVGVSSDSTIIQVLLQLIRHQINQLSLHQIIFLDFLLTQMNPTPLTDALQIALPIVFEIQLPTKIDKSNITNLGECLQYVCKKNVSESCIEYLVGSILKYDGEIDGKQAIRLLWSICELEPDIFLEPLIGRLITTAIVHFDTLNYHEIDTTVSKLTNRCSIKHGFYYNDTFFDLTANYIIDNNYDFAHAIYLLRKFTKIQHVNNNLSDFICKKLSDDPALFEKDPLLSYSLINGIAMTDYKPKYWEVVKEMIEQTHIFDDCTRREIFWLKLAGSLCVLDIYKKEILEHAFRPHYLQKCIKFNHINDIENAILLKSVIETSKLELKSILPDDHILAQLAQKQRVLLEYPLQGALSAALGGAQYVKTCMTTTCYQHIDHVVLMREGGFPIALTSGLQNVHYIEELCGKSDMQVVAILMLQFHHFTINMKLKGSTLLMMKVLEDKGCVVVPISFSEWNGLEDFERIPYLLQEIKLKTSIPNSVTNYSN